MSLRNVSYEAHLFSVFWTNQDKSSQSKSSEAIQQL